MVRSVQRRSIFAPLLIAAAIAIALPTNVAAIDWPGWLGENQQGIWREAGLLERFPKGGPKVMWRTPIGGGYSGPAVVGERLYVMDSQKSRQPADTPEPRGGGPRTERILCFNATDGSLIWKHEYDCNYKISYSNGPRTTPLVHQGKVYTLGAMGDLYCLDATKGNVLWSKPLAKEYEAKVPAWGWAASPVIDGDRLFVTVGGKDSAIVAFNIATGKELWKALTTDEIGYSTPQLIDAGGARQLIVWLSDSITSFDPPTGRVFWTQPYPGGRLPARPSVNASSARHLGDMLFFTSAYHGPLMLKLDDKKPAVTLAWKGKSHSMERPDGLHSLMSTPVLKDGHVFGVCASGELRCLDAKTGKQLWETYDAVGEGKTDCGTAFLVPHADRCFLFNDQGELIIAKLSPEKYQEIDRARIIDPLRTPRGRVAVWSHPAFARQCVFVRNDQELLCVSLAQ
jgi:outer membrane protein assembly factor BamB